MPTPKCWRFERSPSRTTLEEIACAIRDGGVVILPTDTLYGLHADARNAGAIARIQACKGREGTKPLLVLCSSCRQARELGVSMSPATEAALDAIWPAPLTAVLPLREPVAASAGATTIGVRIPTVNWIRELAELTGPIASTSVNYAGEPPAFGVEFVPPEIVDAVDGIVDSGTLEGKPSTIVDFSTSPPTILRQGVFNFSQELWKTMRKSL
ncbi:MAG: L-threonylcarbamoyladenylate synthase [Thermoanaerobaculia bacterium]|nr:L-threonylcarbamoyladenylate synthase [Thermoanaerobaculia bacterium]